MRMIMVAGLVLVVTGSALGTGPAVGAAGGSDDRRGGLRVLYTFDRGEPLTSGSRVVDSAGVRDNGRVLTANGGRLRPVRHDGGRAAQFPDRCVQAGCPRAIVSTAHRNALNPGGSAFSFGTQVRVSPDRTAFTSTLVQKGSFDSPNGRWRLRLNRAAAKPYCLVKGTSGFLRLRAPEGIADGRWHQLTCTRRGAELTLMVDGDVVASATGPIGRVANQAPIRIGGTGTYTKNNPYFGRLDRVFLRIRG